MKKLLSSLLIALTVIVAAAPAHADAVSCKNLYPNSNDTRSVTWGNNYEPLLNFLNTLDVGTYTLSMKFTLTSINDDHDGATYKIYIVNSQGDGTVYQVGVWGDALIGAERILSATLNITNENKGKFTRLYVYGCGKDVVGAMGAARVSDIQIERGSTATSYVPYNPLCATCDGTIVNYTTVTENEVPAGVQNGTPTPTNPIEPVFYKQGDMVLRKVGDVADSYDSATDKITRRVGVKVLNGTEEWGAVNAGAGRYFLHRAFGLYDYGAGAFVDIMCNTFRPNSGAATTSTLGIAFYKNSVNEEIPQLRITYPEITTIDDFKSYLAQQYAAGTPVTVYYPLATPVEETVTQTTYCADTIKIATTAYNAARFSPVVNDLNSTVATIRDIVTKTINQTAAIASLQADKQTRPEDACPAGKKCLLVETEENGVIVPHWFPIIEAPEE